MSSYPQSTQPLRRVLDDIRGDLFRAVQKADAPCASCGGEGALFQRCSCSPFCRHCEGSGTIAEPCHECADPLEVA